LTKTKVMAERGKSFRHKFRARSLKENLGGGGVWTDFESLKGFCHVSGVGGGRGINGVGAHKIGSVTGSRSWKKRGGPKTDGKVWCQNKGNRKCQYVQQLSKALATHVPNNQNPDSQCAELMRLVLRALPRLRSPTMSGAPGSKATGMGTPIPGRSIAVTRSGSKVTKSAGYTTI
jgi:hypothetical protein